MIKSLTSFYVLYVKSALWVTATEFIYVFIKIKKTYRSEVVDIVQI